MTDRNVLGEELEPCSTDPVTGFERDGCCGTHPQDRGRHELCAVMTAEFLEFSKEQGNDLTTPSSSSPVSRPEIGGVSASADGSRRSKRRVTVAFPKRQSRRWC